MRISEGSIVQFKITFILPANDTFTKIDINDPLAAGLEYTLGDAKVYVDANDTPVTAGVDDSLSTSTNILISIDETIAQSDKSKTIDIKIPVLVKDSDALFAAIEAGRIPNPNNPGEIILGLKNEATITAEINGTPQEPVPADALLDFEQCRIFGFGSAYNVDKVNGEQAFVIAGIPGIDSLEQPALTYKFSFEKNAQLNFDGILDSNIVLIVGETEASLAYFGGTIPTNDSDVITIEFPHTGIMKGTIIYVYFPVALSNTITEYTEDHILINSDADLYYFDGTNNIEVCTAPRFDVRINLNEVTPRITIADKIITID